MRAAQDTSTPVDRELLLISEKGPDSQDKEIRSGLDPSLRAPTGKDTGACSDCPTAEPAAAAADWSAL